MVLCDPWFNTYLYNFKLGWPEELIWSQSMYWFRKVQSKKLSPFPRPSTSLCRNQISISGLYLATDDLKSHPRKSFRINERLSNKYYAHKSEINKIGLERRTWWIFYIKQTKTPKNNNWWINYPRHINNLHWFTCSFINE